MPPQSGVITHGKGQSERNLLGPGQPLQCGQRIQGHFFSTEDIKLRVSFSFILLALLADGLDGVVARKTRKSDIGEFLESIADTTSLIIAPAIFIYVVYHDIVLYSFFNHVFLLIALFLYLLLGIIRLASFHIMKKERFFLGLPASSSTIIFLASLINIFISHFLIWL